MEIDAAIQDDTFPITSIFGKEAIISLVICSIFICFHLILFWKLDIFSMFANAIRQKLSFLTNLPILSSIFGSSASSHNNNNNHSHTNIQQRIETDVCCICLNAITLEVASPCGHIFCGICIVDLWESKQRQKLKCPLDRREISMLIRNFTVQQLSNPDPQTKRIIDAIRLYNLNFSSEPRSLKQKLLDAPYLLRNFFNFIRTRNGWLFFVRNILGCLYIALLFIYILSPLDLIPDYLPIVGWIDDFLVIFYVLLYISILYFDFLRGR
jgi:RING finger protein 170